jgi:hypothetical protein
VHLDADLGVLGPQLTEVERTYSVAGAVHIPLFDGRNARARTLRADAELRQREAVLADLTGGIRYDIKAALLDLKAAAAGVQVADSARRLTAQEPSRRGTGSAPACRARGGWCRRGPASAADRHRQRYAHTVAKASLARAMGQVEQRPSSSSEETAMTPEARNPRGQRTPPPLIAIAAIAVVAVVCSDLALAAGAGEDRRCAGERARKPRRRRVSGTVAEIGVADNQLRKPARCWKLDDRDYQPP